jgi:hypothetical protein
MEMLTMQFNLAEHQQNDADVIQNTAIGANASAITAEIQPEQPHSAES